MTAYGEDDAFEIDQSFYIRFAKLCSDRRSRLLKQIDGGAVLISSDDRAARLVARELHDLIGESGLLDLGCVVSAARELSLYLHRLEEIRPPPSGARIKDWFDRLLEGAEQVALERSNRVAADRLIQLAREIVT